MSIDPAVTDEFRDILATVAAVPVTPFGPDGAPDWDCHGRLIRRLVDNGITLVTPNGNTGEFYTLSAEETRAATESAIRAARGRAEVLAGVGHDLPTAISSASHARAAGARMIMIHQPVSPYLSADGWVDYHAAIAEAVPDIGVVLYIRDPRITGRHIRELGERCPNVVGVKYGVRDMVQFAGVARDAGLARFTWLAGLAELTAPGCWTYGAQGFTSGLANVAPQAVGRHAGLAAQRRPGRGPADLGRRAERSRSCAPPTRRRTTSAWSRRPWPSWTWPAGTSARPAACCRTRCARRSARSWPAGAWPRRGPAVTAASPGGRSPEQLRSYGWFGGDGMRAFSHGTRMRQLGADPADYQGKPIIAIVNTWSELNPCHMHLRERAEQVKRGIWEAGGFPAEFGVASLSETFQKPTPMLYRNLLAMDTEELLRSYPADGAVLMGGCDKTTPALLMGAASAGIPAIYLPAGPMLRGNYRGATAGQRHRPVEVLGRQAGRADRRLRDGRSGLRHRPLARALHDDGHRVHHDLGGRGARHDAARRRVHPGGRLRALPDGHRDRPPDRGHGLGAPDPGPDPDRGGVRGRGGHRAGPRRLHQRGDPPHRDGRPLRRAAVAWTTSTRSRAGSRCWPTSGPAGST